MSRCALCASRGTFHGIQTHFHWCTEVGGPGHRPSQAPPKVSVLDRLAAEEAAEKARQAAVTAEIATFFSTINTGLLHREAEASVALDRDQTHVVGTPVAPRPRVRLVPDPPAPPSPPAHRKAAPAPKRDHLRRPEESVWRWSDAQPNWDEISGFELDATAARIHQACLTGLPPQVPYMTRDDVLALEGYAAPSVELALRQPDRVEIRPETAEKGYPVLGFRRGDVVAILGLRDPRHPAVIAAYWTSLLSGYDPHTGRDRTGGGGSKASGGTPTTAKALVKRLRMIGASVDYDEESPGEQRTAQVTYHGQVLGSIRAGDHLPKTDVDSDWNRMQRKIHAIDLRESSVKGQAR